MLYNNLAFFAQFGFFRRGYLFSQKVSAVVCLRAPLEVLRAQIFLIFDEKRIIHS